MRSRRLPWLFWLGAASYLTLTILVATHVLDGFDRSVFRLTVRHHHPSVASAARSLTDVFSPPSDLGALAIGAVVLAWHRRRLATFVVAALTAGTMAVIVLSTKTALGRPLPHTRPGGHADAFPSGHTATFLVCFGTLTLLATTRHRALRPPLLALVGLGTVLIAASLVYDAYHWLTDVVGSAALGTALLAALHGWLSRRTASPSSATDTPPNARTARRH